MKWLTFAAALLAVLALAVAAAGQVPIQQGSREFLGSFAWASASYTYDDEDVYSETALALAPGFGYFVADGTELRVTFPITFYSYDYEYGRGRSDYSQNTYGPQLALLFHFGGTESFVPYVGAGVGASWKSDSDDEDYETVWILPSLHVGARSFFTESACLTTEFFYQRRSNAMYYEDMSANVFGLTAGFSVFF